ncbi:MAG: peptidoglycan-binding protein [Rhodobacteraceae bacterium]|nr:peptidoglycan-binding protein [Paracoccaceae bacterium]
MAGADDIVGGIIGGVIAGGIMSHQQKKTTKVYRAPAVSSATREQNRQVQNSLNYFGFPVGTADGVLGSRSRAAIAEYQMYIGYPSTGQLTDFERNFLIQSYTRAQAGGFATQQTIATMQDGTRGLLRQYRNQQLQAAAMQPQYTPTQPQYAPTQPVVQTPVPAAPSQTTVVVNTNPQAPAVPQQPAVTAAATSQGPADAATALAALAVPNFMADQAEASVTSYCNMVNLRTSSNGGFVTAATMSDPRVALDEQFCLARTFAIANGEKLMDRVKAITPAQIEAQCKQFGPLLKDHVSALSFKSPEEVMQDVGQFVLASGISPTQLKGTAEICLAVGYRTDDLPVTLGSALLLTVLGERPYAEVMGHHLVQGFGASKRSDLALAWYDIGLDALQTGATPVFATTVPERNQLMTVSVQAFGERNGLASGMQQGAAAQPVPASGVPTFAITQ